ncbi:MAG: C-terminal binding protein [Candidatus Tectomicrobia bacterium]|nr:C-terminal binding protein [Candidatus Tectomicrobia bacterium]
MTEPTIAVIQSRFASTDVEAEVWVELRPRIVTTAAWSSEAILDAAAEADAVLAGARPQFTAAVLRRLPRCKGLVFNGVGYNNIDMAAATAQGIAVCNVPDYCVEEVATHTILMLLVLARKLPAALEQVRTGQWNARALAPIPPLDEQILGIIGFGRIGQAVAVKAQAFGLTLWVHDPYAEFAHIRQYGALPVSLEDLASHADFISLHSPLTAETRHLVNAALLRRMKPSAAIINTSRGSLIDEAALLEALNRGALRAAALDVLDTEPPAPDHPLLHHPQVLVTPHAGWYSDAAEPRVRRLSAEEVRRILTGQRPRCLLNPEVLA